MIHDDSQAGRSLDNRYKWGTGPWMSVRCLTIRVVAKRKMVTKLSLEYCTLVTKNIKKVHRISYLYDACVFSKSM